MNKDYEWFLKADLRKYAGKYIAISNKKVVTSGYAPDKVYEKAKRKSPKKEVILWKVPLGDTFVFLSCESYFQISERKN